jgi:hypothetical protein
MLMAYICSKYLSAPFVSETHACYHLKYTGWMAFRNVLIVIQPAVK